MNKFRLKPENFDLNLTLTCGQTFCWHTFEGHLYENESSEYYSFKDGKPVIVRNKEDAIEVETELEKKEVEEMLGMHHELDEVFETFPEDEKLGKAIEEFWGLRIIQDDFFPCLVSYLCSPQMRIPRIKKMFNAMAQKYGTEHQINEQTVYEFPTPEQLSKVSEDELRELGVGYRAKYIVETVKQFESVEESEIREMNYLEAREHLKQFYGVGNKVADCVLLFSLGFYEACPLDTWASKALKANYPEIHHDKYEKTSENMRNHFGELAGYAQEYIFHAARNDVLDV